MKSEVMMLMNKLVPLTFKWHVKIGVYDFDYEYDVVGLVTRT